MLLVQTWYETIFCGALAVGLNRENLHLLEDETFLYWQGACKEHA